MYSSLFFNVVTEDPTNPYRVIPNFSHFKLFAQVRLKSADLQGVAFSGSGGSDSKAPISSIQQINALGPAVRRQCFVLYQYARMCKLLDTFAERLRTGETVIQ